MKILVVGDGPIPNIYMNYRGDPLVRYLRDKGHDVSVICPKPTNLPESLKERYKGIKFFYISSYRSIKNVSNLIYRYFQIKTMTKKIREQLLEERYDVIRAISLFPAYASILANRGQVKIITNLSDFYSDLYKQYDLLFSFLISRILRHIEKVVVSESHLFLVDTEIQREYFRDWGLDEKRCIVLPHGIPRSFETSLDSFRKTGRDVRSKYKLPKDSKVIFYIGDISKLDGIDVLIKAASMIIKEEKRAKFMIVGSGTDDYINYLKNLVKNNNLENYFLFIERIPHQEVPDYISCASLCVAPFRLTLTSNSSLSNKILEYLALGKLIVASRGKGTEEILGDIIRYIDPLDPQTLCKVILSSLKNPIYEKKKKLEKIQKILDWKNIVKREEEIILAFLNKHNKISNYRKFDYLIE
jgi:glycosyltransferase involved in cell wall biosynthesis